MKSQHLYLLCCLTLCQAAIGADIFDLGKPAFTRLGANSELDVYATSIVQDHSGKIYLGGQNTIQTYDGYELKRLKYQNAEGQLTDEALGFMIKLKFDSKGNLWATTIRKGVYHYETSSGKLTQYHTKSTSGHGISADRVDDVIFYNNEVWLATNKGVDILNLETGIIRQDILVDVKLKSKPIRSMAIDKNNNVWLAVRHTGLFYKEPNEETWSEPDYTPEAEALKTTSVYSLFVDSENAIWVGNYLGGFHWVKDFEVHNVNPEKSQYRRIAEPFPGEIWVTTNNQGIQVYDLETGAFLKSHRHNSGADASLGADEVDALFLDKAGTLWIGTSGSGINTINTNNHAFRYLTHSAGDTNSLSAKNIRTILERRNGDVWIVYPNFGIDIVSPDSGAITPMPHAQGNPHKLDKEPTWIVENSRHEVFIGSVGSQPKTFSDATRTFKPTLPSPVENYYAGSHAVINNQDDIVISGLPTLFYDGQKRKWSTVDTTETKDRPGLIFFDYDTDEQGNFWLADFNDLYHLPIDSDTIVKQKLLNLSDEVPKIGRFRQIIIASDGTLYIATSNGLYKAVKWNNKDTVTVSKIDSDFPSFSALEADDGVLWGVAYTYDPKTNLFTRLGNGYGAADWANNSYGFNRTRSGTMMFPTSKGLHLLKPNLFSVWQYQPSLVFTDLSIDDHPYSHTQSDIELSPSQDLIQAKFSALDYTFPKDNQYRYRLKGYDSKWRPSDAKSRTATYTNLAPGNYTLEVQGSNRIGKWSNKLGTINIHVQPAWYQKLQARIIFFLLIATLAYVLYRLRVRQLLAREKQLETMVKLKTRDLEASIAELEETQAKLFKSEKQASLGRLTRGIAHELNTPLGVIKMSYSMLIDKITLVLDSIRAQTLTEESLSKTERSLKGASDMLDKNLERTIELVAYFKRVSVDESPPSMQTFDVEEAVLAAATQLGLGPYLILNIATSLEINADRAAFIEVIAEILLNARNHGTKENQEHPEIGVNAVRLVANKDGEGDRLNLCINDEGIGVAEDQLERIFDPFVSGSASSSSIGLGLHIVYNKVTQSLNGSIRAESGEQDGLSIILELPINKL